MSLFEDTLDEIKENKIVKESGKLLSIPFYKMPKLAKILPGIRKRQYVIITSNTKEGKCFAKGTKIILLNGYIKNIENIEIGDKLLGPDSLERNVLSLGSGEEEMFKISQTYGEEITVNKSHILYVRKRDNYHKKDIVFTLTVQEYFELSERERNKLYLVQSNEISYTNTVSLKIDPYFYGLWLGDGDSSLVAITNVDDKIVNYINNFAKDNHLKIKEIGKDTEKYGKIRYLLTDIPILEGTDINDNKVYYNKSIDASKRNKTLSCYISRSTKNNKTVKGYKWKWLQHKGDFYNFFKEECGLTKKRITNKFLISSIEERYKLLAGIIDSDGHKNIGKNSYEITQKNESLIKDIQFLCRSLGLRSFYVVKYVNNTPYYRLKVSGKNVYKIPVLLDRKKCYDDVNNKSNLFRKFKIISIGIGKYYGLTLDKDCLFLLNDFTIVHNTQLGDFLFVHQPIEYLFNNPNKGIDIFIKYYSLEISSKEKMAQMISYRLFSRYNIIINPNNLLSQFETYTLDSEILKILSSSEFKDYFQFVASKLDIVDSLKYPTGIMMDAENWCKQNGLTLYDKVVWKDNTEHKIIKKHIPNNPDLVFQPMLDHATLLAERGKTLYECIKTMSSEHFLKLKNTYGASPVLIQQQNAESSLQQFNKAGDTVLEKVKPAIEGLAGCKDTRQDCTLMLGIFSPYKYKQTIYEGWDLTKLRDYHREITIMLNRSGRSNISIQTYFNGANSYFLELPLTPTDQQGKIYNFVETNRQKELLMNE